MHDERVKTETTIKECIGIDRVANEIAFQPSLPHT